eukprot:5142410-Amphidinium_carterae.3
MKLSQLVRMCPTAAFSRIASADDTVAMHRRSQNHALQISKLKAAADMVSIGQSQTLESALFHELDDTGDGYLQWEEFRSPCIR